MLKKTTVVTSKTIEEEKQSVKDVEEFFVRCEGKRICIKMGKYYTRKHMWTEQIPEGDFKVGITDYAQKILRDSAGANVALLEIHKNSTVGNDVKADEVFGVVYGRLYANLDLMRCECMAFDLTAPVSGRIVKMNHRTMETPQLMNVSPYEEGWIALIAPSNPQSDLSDLITPKKYKKILMRRERSPFRVI